MPRFDKEKFDAWLAKQKEKSAREKDEYALEAALDKKRGEYASLVDKAAKEEKKEDKSVSYEDAPLVCCRHLTKIYSNRAEAVHDFSLDIKEGEFIVLVGPSGCGKSTTLRMIAGLEDITYGSLYIDGHYSNDLLPKERGVSMVFQSYALYPHMSVYKNMAFGLGGLSKEEIDQRIRAASELLEITPYLDRKPTALSGGQCQRVALGRAIVRNSKIFLLDEPLSNLDAKLRVQMRSELIKLHSRLRNTMIYVTHDQTEAMTMADRIVVMKGGYIQQVGTPREVYDSPSNTFVATFVGSPTMNIIKGHLKKGVITLDGDNTYKLPKEDKAKIDAYYERRAGELDRRLKALEEDKAQREAMAKEKKIMGSLPPHYEEEMAELAKELEVSKKYLETKECPIYFGIRPEDVRIDPKGNYRAAADVAELLGAEYYVHVLLGNEKMVAKVASGDFKEAKGEIRLSFGKGKEHIFDRLSGQRIL